MVLSAMSSNSAAGSFQDEVCKWQRQLQIIEQTVTVWLQVQTLWCKLEEVGERVYLFAIHYE